MGERSRVQKSDLDAEALTIMRYATVAELKANAAELSALLAVMSEADRARLLALAFGDERFGGRTFPDGAS